MKTLFLSAVFATLTGAAHLCAQAAPGSATPAPIPATEPETKATPDARPADKTACGDMACCATGSRAPGKADPAADAKRAADEKAVRKLEQDWCDATANHDDAFIAKAEVDDYTFTDSEGKVTGKADEIAEAKEGGDKIGYKLTDMKVRIYGDTAILNGLTTFERVDDDAPQLSFRWTDTFVRRPGGEWQVAASQATSIQTARGPEKHDE